MLLRYLSVLASFVTGVCLLQIQPVLPALLWPLLVALAAATLVWQAQRWRLAGLIILAATLGFGYADLRANWRLADRLPQNMERQVITARGYVAGLPQTGQFGPRFVFVTQDVLTAGATLPRRLSVQWYGDHPELRSGTRWEFDLSAKRPHGQQNPGGFDVEGWMLQQNLGGSASVKGARPLPGYAWQAAIDRVREGIVDHINAVLGDAPYAGVIAAIATGDRRGISPEQWQSFARAGINHLIVISGLHISMVAALAGLAAGGVVRRIPILARRLSIPRLRLWCGLAAAIGYSLLAGLGIPTERAVLMLAVGVLCLVSARPMARSLIWLLALFIVVLVDPFAVISAGFWLSFLAVGALLWLSGNRLQQARGWRGWASMQLAATLGTLPILLCVFGRMPLISPLANAIAIPVVSMVVTPLTLVGLLDPTGYALQAAERVFAYTNFAVTWLSSLAPSPVFVPPSRFAVAFALPGVLILLLPRGLPGRYFGLVMLLPLFVVPAVRVTEGEFRATVIDVDQGLSVLIQTRQHTLVFDTGKPGQAQRAILPVLQSNGVSSLDTLVVSHKDNDHSGSAEALMRAIPVNTLRAQLPTDHPAHALARQDEPCAAGDAWAWDGVEFTVLWPVAGEPMPDENARGCVLEIETAHARMLITADVGVAQEAAMLERNWLGHFNVVVAGHHGSITSSSLAFVETTHPNWVVYSSGFLNRFRHPRPEIVARYAAQGAQDLRTDRDGAVIITTSGSEVAIERWRETHPHYWFMQW